MEYLNKLLGIQVTYEDSEYKHMPNYLVSRYEIKKVLLDKVRVFFLYLKTDLEQIAVVKKHIAQIKKIDSIPVVLVLKQMTFRQREYLIRDKISFIVEGKQVYLPFMGIYLQERCDAENVERKEILPSAQMLLLYFIYCGAKELITSQAAKDLKLTSTSISRASKQLEQMGIIKTRKQGVQKVIFSECTSRELYCSAKDIMVNPVKRCVYVPMDKMEERLLKSGYSALSDYSMLNPPAIKRYAADSIAKWNKIATAHLQNSDEQVAVELWKYDPARLSNGKAVDVLSLALSLRDDEDERVEEAVEEMLEALWRKINSV